MLTETTGDGIREMALRCYGYGGWSAPYWFIGPGQVVKPKIGDRIYDGAIGSNAAAR